MSNPVRKAIGTRRVVRSLTEQPVEREKLERILTYAAPIHPRGMGTWGKITWQGLVDWERFPNAHSTA